MNARIDIAAVRASQDLAKSSIPLIMRHAFVPAAWPLTVIAARLGVSPNGATLARAAVSACGLTLIACPSGTAFAAGLGLFVLAKIADSVDGNLARLQDRASYFGKYVDGLVDMVEDLAFPLALAAHLWLAGEADDWVLLAGAVAVFALAVVFISIYRLPLFEAVLEKERGAGAAVASRAAHPRLDSFFQSGVGRILRAIDEHGVNAAFDARFLALAAALILDFVPTYLVFLASLYALGACLIVVSRVLRGLLVLDVHRRSRSAA